MSLQDPIYIKGDTIEMQFQLFQDKVNNVYWNLTGHQVRFQLNTTPKIYKATSNVTGGSSDQINIIDAAHGIFLVSITCEESAEIAPGDYKFEIQVTTPSPNLKKYTVEQSTLRVHDEVIVWEDEPEDEEGP